jgi:acetyl esterase/lipase
VNRNTPSTFLALAIWLAASASAQAADAARHLLNIPYAKIADQTLALDLHLPAAGPAPLVVYVHGGAWMSGDKTAYPEFFLQAGYAVASLDFRSTNVAPFPANVHDIKASIRFLRANAGKYGYRADRIALVGASSGAHLAALVGVTSGNAQLEGTLGDNGKESSSVQAIISYFGASNLETLLSQSTPDGVKMRVPALQKLLGNTPDRVPELAKLGSPVNHVDRNDPPALLMHGDQDQQMPVNQTLELQAAYRRAGLTAEINTLNGVGHVAPPFFGGEPAAQAVEFLRRTIGR